MEETEEQYVANPQIENGYTAIANEILDNLYKLSLNGTELKVINCIFRYTFGFHRKSHKLSASFIARWGNCDSRAVKRALKKLQQDRIVICINSEQRGVTAELMFNKNYEQWCTGGQNVTSGENDTGGQNVTGVVVKMSPEPVVKMSHKKEKRNKNLKKKSYDDFFEKAWKSYPRKLGKSDVTQKAKKELFEAGEEVVLGAVNLYIAAIQENETAERYIMYGSTFFNGRWRDYVKESGACVKATVEEETEKPIDLWGED